MNSFEMIAAAALLASAYILWNPDSPSDGDKAMVFRKVTKSGVLVAAAIGILADFGPATEVLSSVPDILPGVLVSSVLGLLTYKYVGCRRQFGNVTAQLERELRDAIAQLARHNKALVSLANNRYLRFQESLEDVHRISDNGDTEVTRTFTTEALPGEIVPWRVFSLGCTAEDEVRTFREIKLEMSSPGGGRAPDYFPIQEDSKTLRALVIPPQPIRGIPYTWQVDYEWPKLFKRLFEQGEDSHNLELKWDHYGSVTQTFVFPKRTVGSFKHFPKDGQFHETEVDGRFALVWTSDNPIRGAHEFTIQLEPLVPRSSGSPQAVSPT
jgi:hypothetical protein